MSIDLLSSIVWVCRFRKNDEKVPYINPMKQVFPIFYNIIIGILPNHSEPSVCLQHWILKIFYCTMHVRTCPLSLLPSLPLSLLPSLSPSLFPSLFPSLGVVICLFLSYLICTVLSCSVHVQNILLSCFT